MHKDLEKFFPRHIEREFDPNDLSPQQHVARKEIVMELLNSKGFSIINEYVLFILEGLRYELGTAKPENIAAIQGRIEGIQAYHTAVDQVKALGDNAMRELEEDAEIRKQEKAEGPPQ